MSGQVAAVEERPRWATYSVKAHQNLERLICDLLLFDVLVFPCPSDEPGEYERWEQETWQPSLLQKRIKELGRLAVGTPWDSTLRDVWKQHWYNVPADERHGPEIAFQVSAAMLAEQPLYVLLGEDDPRFGAAALAQPRIHPAFGSPSADRAREQDVELVSVFHSTEDSAALTGTHGLPTVRRPEGTLSDGRTDGIRVRWQLASPADANEKTWRKVIDLVRDESFRKARHRLWAWEAELGPNTHPRDLTKGLESLVADYNAAVRRQKIATASRWVYVVVPPMVGHAADVLFHGGWTGTEAGIATTAVLEAVKARFPTLSGSAEKASHHPGSAASGLLAIAGPALAPQSTP